MSKDWILFIIIVCICLIFIMMIWIAGNLKVDGRQCKYVQINYAWQISAQGCK